MIYKFRNIIFLLLSITCFQAFAKVELPRFFSSHMVLQRDEPIVIYGYADIDEVVTVSFLGSVVKVEPNTLGKWKAIFDAKPAGGPYTLEIEGHNKIILSDVYLGDVWFCSGQSNMGWKLENSLNGEEELANANYDKIKLFTAQRYMSSEKQDELKSGKWEACTPQNAEGFSAVAYFFGRNLYETYDVPIGLINSSWGGTNIEAWMDAKFFEGDTERQPILKSMEGMDMVQAVKDYKEAHGAYAKAQDDQDLGIKNHWESPQTDYSNWETFTLPSLWRDTDLEKTYGVVWVTKAIELREEDLQDEIILSLGRIDDEDITYINGKEVGASTQKDLDRVYVVPRAVLKEGANRITIKTKNLLDLGGFRGADSDLFVKTNQRTISLAGKWCYSVGTPNISEPPTRIHPRYYPTSLYNSMVHPFFGYNIKGVIWYQGESNTKNPEEYSQFFPGMILDWRSKWHKEVPFLFVQLANYANQQDREASIREAQTSALKLPKTAMIVTLDIGEDANVHPKNKQEVGRRLALAAQNIAYGNSKAPTGGPQVDKVEFKENAALVIFTEPIHIKGDKKAINGFLISDDGKEFIKTEAEKIDDKTVKVFSEKIKPPKAIRYLWEDAPGDVMIFNNSGLPAPPFRMDNSNE